MKIFIPAFTLIACLLFWLTRPNSSTEDASVAQAPKIIQQTNMTPKPSLDRANTSPPQTPSKVTYKIDEGTALPIQEIDEGTPLTSQESTEDPHISHSAATKANYFGTWTTSQGPSEISIEINQEGVFIKNTKDRLTQLEFTEEADGSLMAFDPEDKILAYLNIELEKDRLKLTDVKISKFTTLEKDPANRQGTYFGTWHMSENISITIKEDSTYTSSERGEIKEGQWEKDHNGVLIIEVKGTKHTKLEITSNDNLQLVRQRVSKPLYFDFANK
jgi:hypothetical protein